MKPEQSPRPIDELPPLSAEFHALNMLAETYLTVVGRDAALEYLHVLASSLEKEADNVFNFRAGPEGAKAQLEARAWLRRCLTVWLARHG